MATLKEVEKEREQKRQRIFTSKPSPIYLDSTASVLMDVLTNLEVQFGTTFSIVGGFVRNSLAGRTSNDFDICTIDTGTFRKAMSDMGILQIPEQYHIDGVRQHDLFTNPYDMSGRTYPIHWINDDDQYENPMAFAPRTFDFSVNEFSLKSDGQLYAPTYAWRHWERRILKANLFEDRVMTTNLAMRAVRFASLLGFELDPQTKEAVKQKIKSGKLDNKRLISNLFKIMQDGVSVPAIKLLNELEFQKLKELDNDLGALIAYYQAGIGTGMEYGDAQHDYHE